MRDAVMQWKGSTGSYSVQGYRCPAERDVDLPEGIEIETVVTASGREITTEELAEHEGRDFEELERELCESMHEQWRAERSYSWCALR